MATAAQLINGFQYEVLNGPLASEVVTIKSNTPVPDGEPNQRKVLVELSNGNDCYILPRQLLEIPVGMVGAAPVAASEPTEIVHVFDRTAEALDPDVELVDPPVVAVRAFKPITDPMDPRLDRFRPSKRKWNSKGTGQYVSRIMSNGMTDVDFFLNLTSDEYRVDPNNEGRPASLLLKGDTQGGKTMLVEVLAIAWAEALGHPKPMPIFTISGSAGVTDYDLFGQTTAYTNPETGQESLVWLPGMAELAANCGGILYIDETNALDARTTSSLNPLTDHRHMFINRNKAVWADGQFMPEVTKASLDLWIIGTLNEGYVGMSKLNEAFVNRFEQYVWEYNGDVEAKLIKSAAIRLLGDALRTARSKNTLRTPIGTAALIRAERNVRVFGTVLGLELLTSMFGPQERPVVESIIEDRSIIILLNEELRQAEAERQARGE